MEALLSLTLFGSTIALGAVSLALIIALFCAESEHSFIWGLVAISCFIGLNHFWGNLPLNEMFTFKTIFSYLLLGFAYAMIRTYFKGRELKGKNKEHFDLKWAVFTWWFLFPISLISWIFSKLMKDLWNWIYDLVESLFRKIFFLGDSVKIEEEVK